MLPLSWLAERDIAGVTSRAPRLSGVQMLTQLTGRGIPIVQSAVLHNQIEVSKIERKLKALGQ